MRRIDKSASALVAAVFLAFSGAAASNCPPWPGHAAAQMTSCPGLPSMPTRSCRATGLTGGTVCTKHVIVWPVLPTVAPDWHRASGDGDDDDEIFTSPIPVPGIGKTWMTTWHRASGDDDDDPEPFPIPMPGIGKAARGGESGFSNVMLASRDALTDEMKAEFEPPASLTGGTVRTKHVIVWPVWPTVAPGWHRASGDDDDDPEPFPIPAPGVGKTWMTTWHRASGDDNDDPILPIPIPGIGKAAEGGETGFSNVMLAARDALTDEMKAEFEPLCLGPYCPGRG